MSTGFFGNIRPIRYEGPQSANPLAYRHYDPDEIVMGKRMEDHLRFAVAYWHSFTWPGGDPFGGETFNRPWMHMADPMAAADAKRLIAARGGELPVTEGYIALQSEGHPIAFKDIEVLELK